MKVIQGKISWIWGINKLSVFLIFSINHKYLAFYLFYLIDGRWYTIYLAISRRSEKKKENI